MELAISIISGRNLGISDKTQCFPYGCIDWQGQSFFTEVLSNTVRPQWKKSQFRLPFTASVVKDVHNSTLLAVPSVIWFVASGFSSKPEHCRLCLQLWSNWRRGWLFSWPSSDWSICCTSFRCGKPREIIAPLRRLGNIRRRPVEWSNGPGPNDCE